MSAKLPYSIGDENPDLHKQIGCMNGIFQLFGRSHFLSSRRISSHNHKRLPPGQSGNHGTEPNSNTQKAIETNLKEVVKEKQRVSVESSRTSFSNSSCSSAFSSVESSKKAQPEPSSLGQQQSLDLRDVVKDSICRETSELSVKTVTKAKGVRHVVKNVDSPRPLQLPYEEKSRSLPSKDAPRFSYDGRESRDKQKSALKLKELPRLSLDSREGSIRRLSFVDKRPSTVVAKLMGLEAFPDSKSGKDDQIREIKCCPDESLDTMTTSSRKADESKLNKASLSPRNVNPPMKPKSRVPLEPAPWRQPDGNRGSQRQAPIYQEAHIKTQNPSPSVYGEIEKRLTELEFKRSGKDLRALKQILESMEKTRERLENKKEGHASDLEPQTSKLGPNYLNLHQITPTIRKTGPSKKLESPIAMVKTTKVVQKPRNSCSSANSIEGISGLRKLRTRENVDSRKDSVDRRTTKDLTQRNNHFRLPTCHEAHSTVEIKNARAFRSTQASKPPQHTSGRKWQKIVYEKDSRTSTAVSPRLQQKKMEKESCRTTQASDSSRSSRYFSKQQIESGSPSRKFNPKSPNSQEVDDQLSEFSSETRYLIRQGDAISEQSESNLSFASQSDIEVTSTDRSKESKEIAARSRKDRSKAEPTTTTLEQPSPVSVLDTFYREESPSPVKKISNAFKDEETLSSDEAEWSLVDLDHSLNSTRRYLSPEFGQEKLESIKYLVHKLSQVNSKHDEASTDHIASLCENTNPEHRYITEILLASGILLKDLSSSSIIIQLHSLCHLIDPNLFLVLEQTKGRIEQSDDEHNAEKIGQSKFNQKIHRKLIFETVNELLGCKLSSPGFSEPWISPNKLGVRSLSGRKLLKELCSEMDQLQANTQCSLDEEHDGLTSILREDMMDRTPNWADYHSEVPGVALDIERLIFKDLIGEIVSSEAASLKGRPTKHCRQLFSK